MDEIVALTINGEPVTAHRDMTILQVCREYGIAVPTLCHLRGISGSGGCRLCLVEVKGSNSLQTACTTPVENGLAIQTHSPRVEKYRKIIVELLLAEGDHVCSVCASNGSCELQQLAERLGVDGVRFEYYHPEQPVDETHDRFEFNPNLCILCTRCVRVCEEVEQARTLAVSGKGMASRVIMDYAEGWGAASTCTSCGKCITVCPTGAMFDKYSTSEEAWANKRFMQTIQSRVDK